MNHLRRGSASLAHALALQLARLQGGQHPEPELSEKLKAAAPTIRENRTEVPQSIRPSRFQKSEKSKQPGQNREKTFGKIEWEQADPADASAQTEPSSPERISSLELYQEKFKRYQGGQDELGVSTREEQVKLQAALDCYGMRRLEQLMEVFFQSDSPLLHHAGYGLRAFLDVLPTLAVLRLKASVPAPDQVLGAAPRAVAHVAPQQE